MFVYFRGQGSVGTASGPFLLKLAGHDRAWSRNTDRVSDAAQVYSTRVCCLVTGSENPLHYPSTTPFGISTIVCTCV